MFTRVNISLSHATQPEFQGHLQYFSELIKNYFQNIVLKLQFEESLFSMELLKKGWLYVSIYLSKTWSIYLSAIGMLPAIFTSGARYRARFLDSAVLDYKRL